MNEDRRDDGEHDDSELLESEVPMDAAGKRFDQVLAAMFPDFSRSRLSEWIKSGDALLDGRTVKPREAVRGGEPVAVRVTLETETRAEPEDIPLVVLHEDSELLVIDKPAGLVVHPGAGNPRGTLVNALLFRDPKLAELPRAGIVHRLDKDTSGVMVVARTLRAHTSLVEQLAGREVHRQYVAIVAGPIIAGTTIDAPIGRHPTDRVRMAVVNNGRPSVTHYRVREKFRAHTLVECRLETGRTHQIRVHMAYVKHPVIGDPMYARLTQPKGATEALSEGLRAFRRQALHAERLVFRHPATGEELATDCAIPADMQQMLALLREDSAAFKARGGR